MANSDIIKIGFDYRASLEQFEKETNGVFDGISNKAGKQKITIQLDAKDDKVIDKIKELQKLKLDKFTFEFGDSGLKEQLQTFDKLENKINEIINLGKGKSFIDSSSITADIERITDSAQKLSNILDKSFNVKNKIEAFNQLKEAYKDYNEIDLTDGFDKAGVEAAYSFWKSYEEAINKNVAESRLEAFGDIKQNKRSLSDGIIDNYKQILFDYKSIESEIIKNNNGIFPSLDDYTIKDINNYVYALYRIREAEKDIQEINKIPINQRDEYNLEDLSNAKGVKEYYQEQANTWHEWILSSIQNQGKLQNELKETREEIQKTDNILNTTSSSNNDSQIEDLKSDIAEVKTELGEVKDRISNIESNSFENIREDVEKTKESVKELNSELTEMKSNLSSTPQESNISSASTESVINSIKEENNVLEQNTQKVKENTQAKEQNANVNLNKYDKRLDSYNGKVDKYQATIDRFNDGGWTSDAYLKNVQAVKNAVDEYETLLKELKGKDASLVTSEDISELDNYEKKIKDTIATVTNMSAAEKGYNFVSGQKELDKIHKLLAENSKMSAEAKTKIRAYYAEIESGNPSMSLDKIHGEIMKIYNAEVEAGRAGRTLWDTMKNSGFHQIAAQMAGMVGVYDIINLGKEGFNVVRELNTALTEMRKVSNETVQSLKNYQATTFDTADAVGTTAKQIQNSTADWMRLGESMNQAAESAKDANVLLNVSEFEGIDEATESLVSMSQAYKDLDKMDIIDVLNNIGNNYSISTDGLATALKDSASALVTANNDLNEAVSLTTAGNAITQDPSKVGAGLRTISLRLVGTEEAKQELSDLGEETDGMITTVSKLRDTIMDATKAASSDGKGFDILDSNGNYKSTYEIMQGLADLYDDIVKKDKELGTNNLNLLLETIAGKNRSNIAASILQNGDMLRSVYEDAQNSEGSAEKELNSYLDSIDGKMAQLENRAQEFWFKVIDSETIKNGIDLLSTLLKGATDFVDTVGLLPTIFTGIGAVLSLKNVGECNYIS